jgi:hypothetical protein
MRGPAGIEPIAEVEKRLFAEAPLGEGLAHPHPIEPVVMQDARVDRLDALDERLDGSPAGREVGGCPKFNPLGLARLRDHEGVCAIAEDVRV